MKILILIPDGVGLRNFAFTDFHAQAERSGLEIVYWNATQYDLARLGYDEIKIGRPQPNPLTDILKRARCQIDLTRNIQKSGDEIYEHYRFPFSFSDVKTAIKSVAVLTASKIYNSDNGLIKIRKSIKRQERKTQYYLQCKATLEREKPDLVFCTNQRPLTAIAPVLAAQDLGIPTAVFIFSWDNLPKATMVVEADYYFVWSSHMRNELLYYYPYLDESQIFVTGTPQFETHSDKSIIRGREFFFEENGLDINKKYICYSGDDITTSPNDPAYLSDTADAVRNLNERGYSLGIIFRRCPVDFSDRFDAVLDKNRDIITAIDPVWAKFGEQWDAILPTPEDLILQMNTIAHSEMVINLGSSMVFDFVMFDKPCAYINYDVAATLQQGWSAKTVYKFVHFRSMPDKSAVVWINNPGELADKIEQMLNDKPTVGHAKEWFSTINLQPSDQASARIMSAIKASFPARFELPMLPIFIILAGLK